MALGGGTFLVQNKILPGSYINFVSAARASATLSDRGIAAVPYTGSWGPEGEVFLVTAEDLQKNSLRMLGYPYTAQELRPFREVLQHARQVYAYRLNTGAVKAVNQFATARYGGTRGNDITVVIEASIDQESGFDVTTLLAGSEVDVQTVTDAGELKANDFVTFRPDSELEATAGAPLTGGTDGTAASGLAYQSFLDGLEEYSFHTLGCPSDDKEVIALFTAFTKRMRDEVGVKFQTVVYRGEGVDHEGIVSVENETPEEGNKASLVYWVTGALAGCQVNQSCANKVYDGEYVVSVAYTQRQLEEALGKGKFIFHKVGDSLRVLDDINTFVSVTADKNADFGSNQTIRVLDQIGNDIAALFNSSYLGKVPNDPAGRISFWNDVVTYHRELETLRAITGFAPEDVTVEQGNDKKSVVVTNTVEPVNCMAKLYMTVVVE